MRMGWLDINGKKSPFLDQRVRQAMAMAIDREAYLDAFENVSKFRAEGVPEQFADLALGWNLAPRETDPPDAWMLRQYRDRGSDHRPLRVSGGRRSTWTRSSVPCSPRSAGIAAGVRNTGWSTCAKIDFTSGR